MLCVIVGGSSRSLEGIRVLDIAVLDSVSV